MPAERAVFALIDDLFFSSRVESVARQVGVACRVFSSADALRQQALAGPPALLVVDLNHRSGSSVASIRQFKEDPALKDVPVVGFLSHVQVDLQQAAQEAGCEQVLPRSTFTSQLPAILKGASEG